LVRQPINGNRLNFKFEVQPVFVFQKYIVFKNYFCKFAPPKPVDKRGKQSNVLSTHSKGEEK